MIRNVLWAVGCSWLWFCLFSAFSTNQLECLLLLLRGFHFSLHIHLKKQTEQWQPCPFLNQFLQATLQTSLLLPPMAWLLICHCLFRQQKQCFRSVCWVLLLEVSDTGYKFPRGHIGHCCKTQAQERLHFIVLLVLGKQNFHSGFDEKFFRT